MKNKKQNLELSAQEKEFLNNLDKTEKSTKNFGFIRAKKYFGKNVNLEFLNLLKDEQNSKYVGSLQMIVEGGNSIWYLDAIDGEKYRIPEPKDGIDVLFDVEFKRNEV